MRVELAYGRGRLPLDVPDQAATVLEPTYIEGLADETAAVRTALREPLGRPPLRDFVAAGQRVAISICDSTRPMPSHIVLPVILEELTHIPSDDVVVLIATGTHRPTTDDELKDMLGPDVLDRCHVVNHNAFDRAELRQLPDVEPHVPVWLNRRWVDADIRITAGFVEPHFFAGFSGGPKMVAPGLAGIETTMRLHDAEMIGSAAARWGVTDGNPIHDAIRRIARQCGVSFSVDVAINRDRRITHVAGGELFAVHSHVRAIVKRSAMQGFASPFDTVITTNSGYPLDQNLYQTVKGLSAAAQVVKRGGVILCASECIDGLPSHGEYETILGERETPAELLEMICGSPRCRHDQWEVQVQAQIQARAAVYLKTSGLTDAQVRAAHLTPVHDLGAAMHDVLAQQGPEATLCILPEGPQTIPYLLDEATR